MKVSYYLSIVSALTSCMTGAACKLAIEALPPDSIAWLTTRRIGLIANHTSRDRQGRRTVDILQSYGIRVACIFAPEHGFDGTLAAGTDVHDLRDAVTGIPVIGIYNHGPRRRITEHKVAELDVLVFDIQDSGMRHYTYISTLLHMMQCAAHYTIPFMVFDRPNPLGGIAEGPIGPLLQLPHGTLAPIDLPLRHGMTIGELAHYFNAHGLHMKVDVRVVPMVHYDKSMRNPPVASYALSPNIQSKNACYGYSFLGLLGEVRPFDIGIGTDLAFQCILLPEDTTCPVSAWRELAAALAKNDITSTPYRYYSERKKKWCKGLKLSITDGIGLHAYPLFLEIIRIFKRASVPISFAAGFDKAVGSEKVRQLLMQ